MKMYELDICTETVDLNEAIEKINSFEGATVIMTAHREGAWPTVTVAADENGLAQLEEWYGDSLE